IDDITSPPVVHRRAGCLLHINHPPRHVSGQFLPTIKICRQALSELPHSAGGGVVPTRRSHPQPNHRPWIGLREKKTSTSGRFVAHGLCSTRTLFYGSFFIFTRQQTFISLGMQFRANFKTQGFA
ncbi:hypothetical protein TcCL_Unassigned04927, partial [Trypanosoma cruzi]